MRNARNSTVSKPHLLFSLLLSKPYNRFSTELGTKMSTALRSILKNSDQQLLLLQRKKREVYSHKILHMKQMVCQEPAQMPVTPTITVGYAGIDTTIPTLRISTC